MSSIIIVNYLLARDAAVKAIVSNRIFPIQAPQNTTGAYITTNEVGSKSHDLTEGPGKYYRDRVTIEGISPSALTSIQLGRAVMSCLEGVIDRQFTDYKDITITFAGVAFSDQNDVQTAFRDIKQFHVWWRAKD